MITLGLGGGQCGKAVATGVAGCAAQPNRSVAQTLLSVLPPIACHNASVVAGNAGLSWVTKAILLALYFASPTRPHFKHRPFESFLQNFFLKKINHAASAICARFTFVRTKFTPSRVVYCPRRKLRPPFLPCPVFRFQHSTLSFFILAPSARARKRFGICTCKSV